MPLVFRIPIKKALKKNTRLDEIEAKTDTFAKDMHDWIMGLETKARMHGGGTHAGRGACMRGVRAGSRACKGWIGPMRAGARLPACRRSGPSRASPRSEGPRWPALARGALGAALFQHAFAGSRVALAHPRFPRPPLSPTAGRPQPARQVLLQEVKGPRPTAAWGPQARAPRRRGAQRGRVPRGAARARGTAFCVRGCLATARVSASEGT